MLVVINVSMLYLCFATHGTEHYVQRRRDCYPWHRHIQSILIISKTFSQCIICECSLNEHSLRSLRELYLCFPTHRHYVQRRNIMSRGVTLCLQRLSRHRHIQSILMRCRELFGTPGGRGTNSWPHFLACAGESRHPGGPIEGLT